MYLKLIHYYLLTITKRSLGKKNLVHLPWTAWLLTILVLSFLPGDKLPELNFTLFELDKLIHFGLYFVLANLMGFAFLNDQIQKKSKKNEPFLKRIVWIVATGMLIGYLVEVIQGNFVPNRAYDMFDVLANSIGTIIGIIFFVKFRLKKLKIW